LICQGQAAGSAGAQGLKRALEAARKRDVEENHGWQSWAKLGWSINLH